MNSFGRFVSRTQDMYSDMQTCISTMVELQNERRRIVNRRRQHLQNNRDLHESRHIVFNDSNDSNNSNNSNSNNSNSNSNSNNNDTTILDGSQGSRATSNSDIPPVTRGVDNSVRNAPGLGRASLPGLSRSPLFDMGNIFYSIPRTVLLNPTTTSSRRLTISEIEENTEIMTYGSIPSNYILNTECPIARETFTPESVVLTLKHCKHCFVPFRMMTWLETNSTCPLCRSNVVRPAETPQTAAPDSNRDDANDDSQNPDNISISNIFNTLMQTGNNEFDNLSVDNMNDNSIVFSFDLPRSQVNTNSETSIVPQIERLLANTLSRSNGNSGNTISRTNATPPDSTTTSRDDTNDDNNYPEVD
jgi:predicted Zn-ribbon and HTH transcriptional regulator